MSNVGLNRNNNEKFYTKSDVAQECYDNFILYIQPNVEKDLIIEPSAGCGRFSNIICCFWINFKFYDILPEGNMIEEQDFLELDLNIMRANSKIHVIGNPPFGRQSTLAKKFIKNAANLPILFRLFYQKVSKKIVFKNHLILITI